MIKKPNDSCLRLLLGMTGLLTTSSNGRTLAHGTDSATYATVQRNKIPEEVETLTAAFDDARASLQASRAVRLCRWLLQTNDCIDDDAIPLTQEFLDARRAPHHRDHRSPPVAERGPDPLPPRPHPGRRSRGARGHRLRMLRRRQTQRR